MSLPICCLYSSEYFSPKISAYLGDKPFSTDVVVSRDIVFVESAGVDSVTVPEKAVWAVWGLGISSYEKEQRVLELLSTDQKYSLHCY